jgi:hypothetical protein
LFREVAQRGYSMILTPSQSRTPLVGGISALAYTLSASLKSTTKFSSYEITSDACLKTNHSGREQSRHLCHELLDTVEILLNFGNLRLEPDGHNTNIAKIRRMTKNKTTYCMRMILGLALLQAVLHELVLLKEFVLLLLGLFSSELLVLEMTGDILQANELIESTFSSSQGENHMKRTSRKTAEGMPRCSLVSAVAAADVADDAVEAAAVALSAIRISV